MTTKEESAIDQRVFETFAIFYPHEAAASNWPRFVAFVQQRHAEAHLPGPPPSEDEIRLALTQTLDADERARRDAEQLT